MFLIDPTLCVHSRRMVTTEYAAIDLHVLRRDESGRTTPFVGRVEGSSADKPHLRIVGTSEFLGVAFVEGPAWIYPGDHVEATVAFLYVETGVDYSGLVVGTTVDVLEGFRIVARGIITRRWNQPTSWFERAPA